MAIIISRNAVQYLRRHAMADEPARPKPRLDVSALLVHTIPLASPPKPQAKPLVAIEGDEPGDRHITRPWPGQ